MKKLLKDYQFNSQMIIIMNKYSYNLGKFTCFIFIEIFINYYFYIKGFFCLILFGSYLIIN